MKTIELIRIFEKNVPHLCDVQRAMEHANFYFHMVSGEGAGEDKALKAVLVLP